MSSQKLTSAKGDVWVYEAVLGKDKDGAFWLDVKIATDADAGNEVLQNPEFPRGQKLRCDLEGVEVEATLELWANCTLLLDDPPPFTGSHATALRLICSEVVGPDVKLELFEFLLPHVDFGSGDFISFSKAKNGRSRSECDHITFQLDGVAWTLRKLFEVDNRVVPAPVAFDFEEEREGEAIRSIRSSYSALQVATDEIGREDAEETAERICWLLCLALGQRVSWSELWTRRGREERFLKRRSAALPSAPSGMRPITNREEELKHYLEASYPRYRQDDQWWAETLRWYAVTCDASTVEVSAMIFSMLLDRLSTRILQGYSFPKQIGDDLASRLDKKADKKELAARLSDLMSNYTSGWNDSRSMELVRKIIEWNDRPSFGKKIAEACARIGIVEPPARLVSPRHTIFHDGVFTKVEGDILEYHNHAHQFLTALLFQILGYSGKFFCPRCGIQDMQNFSRTECAD